MFSSSALKLPHKNTLIFVRPFEYTMYIQKAFSSYAPLPKITTVLKPERTCGDLSSFKCWRGRKTRLWVKKGRLKWKEKQVHSSL